MTEDQLPREWMCLDGLVSYVKRRAPTEYSCSCPTCGGVVHANGEWPDRCRLFVDDHPTMWCRQCGLVGYPDQFGDERFPRPSQAELESMRKQREAEAEARLRSAQHELELLRDAHLWESYHQALEEHGRQWWRSRGIPDAYQNFWGLGWSHERNAASIPLFGAGWTFQNLKYRMVDESRGRYRYHVTGLPAPMFLCDPDIPLDNHVIAVEGEIKAQVVSVTLDDNKHTIVGLPALTPSKSITDTLAKADSVTLVLDPGADKPNMNGWSPMGRLVKAIGRDKCRVLIPPDKIDDMILAAHSSSGDVRAYLGQAVRT